MDVDLDEEAHKEGVASEKVFSMQPKLITTKPNGFQPALEDQNQEETSDQ
jgi:hypothetical protein